MQEYNQNKTLKVGYIGLGDHALENLLPSILLTPELELVAISTRNGEKLDKFAQKFNPKFITQNWEEIIDPDLVDIVVVSSIPEIHYKVTKACLENGLHCFIEKPPTQNIDQLKELIKMKQNTNLLTFVGYNFSFSDSYNKLLLALDHAPIKLAKFKFIVGKLNQATDGFGTVLESCLYKMFVHPMHTLYKTFGEYQNLEVFEQTFEDNKFSMQVYFTFKNGSKAVLDWGNYSNRFECKFELTNFKSETGILDNLGHYELWNMQNHSFDKGLFKSKERLIFDNSPLLGGYERTGYQREFELFTKAILENRSSDCELEQSLEIYRAINDIKAKSKIQF